MECPECRFSRRVQPGLLVSTYCPRCRLRGRAVTLEEVQVMTRVSTSSGTPVPIGATSRPVLLAREANHRLRA